MNPRPDFIWTLEAVEALERHWASGISCSQIALAMGEGLTRNAVIGKVRRLDLPRRSQAVSHTTRAQRIAALDRKRAASKSRPKADPIIAGVAAKRAGPANPLGPQFGNRSKSVEPLDMEDGEPVDVTNFIGIMDLTAHTCRWPHGDPLLPGFGYCGKSTKAKSVWCPSHHDRVFLRSTR